jgi:nicotinamide-nucleotide amidase
MNSDFPNQYSTSTPDDLELEDITARVSEAMLAHGHHLATAESCTGGWVAKLCTDLAGSSAWFERGFVTYANAAKVDMLGVPETTLVTHGAVSEETVRAMAIGALAHSSADYALAISGIAGPSGGSSEKPVGTVWLAWARSEEGRHVVVARQEQFSGDREDVRRQAVWHALAGLLAWLSPPLSV